MFKSLFTISICAILLLTSCSSSFWESMATGMGAMGSGIYGGTTSMYSGVPYGLQPNVAVEQSAAIINNNMQSQINDMWKNGVPVDPVGTSTVVIQTNGSGSATNNSGGTTTVGSSSGNSTSGRQHDLCNGTGKCKTCNGTGQMWKGYGQEGKTRCPNCNGTGRCSGCNGTGRK